MMRIVLFRHAEKQNNTGGNPPLSERGRKQALSLVQDIEKGELPRPNKVLSSPKLRTQQTMQPITDFYNLDLQMDPLLDERNSGESIETFHKRIQKALHSYEKLSGVLYLATHFDWIEEALPKLHCDTDMSQARFSSWSPAQHIEFEIHDGLWQFKKMRGSPWS